jgi:hypothetical protein
LFGLPTMPVFTLAGAGRQQHGPKTPWRGEKEGSAHQQLPGLRRPPGWCVIHLFEDGAPEDGGVDPSKEAPGFHARLMVLGSPETPSQQPAVEEPAPELPAHQQPASMGPMMENFDSFLEHYDPTDEQISLGAQLLLGCSSDLDATMERLLMSMMGSLETYATAVEAGINY